MRPEQRHYVPSNAVSIAAAHNHQQAWIRAIYAGETPVGLVMLHDENLRDTPEVEDLYGQRRLMIDAEHQGKGYGSQAVKLQVEHVKSNPNGAHILTNYKRGEHSPEGFYRKLGFEHTGRVIHDEREMRLKLT